MDIANWVVIILLIITTIVSLVFGIILLVKFAKTRKIWQLVLGIILTFVIPAIVLYFVFRFYVFSTAIAYGPSPM